MTAVLLALLLRVVRQARRTDPFTTATVGRLRMLAGVALAGGYLAVLVEGLAATRLAGTVVTEGLAARAEVPFAWLLIGLGLLALAEVIRRGTAMRAELETLI